MKKLFLFLILLSLSLSSVSALSTLSSSQIDFQSNNALYNGPAFVVLGVENGGNDIITWTINNFANEVDNGYEMTKTGTISSDFKSEGFNYALRSVAPAYGVRSLGTSVQWGGISAATSWCSNLGGDWVAATYSPVNFVCIEYYVDGYFHSLRPGEYKYDVDYKLTVDGQGSDTFTLTETTNTGGKMIGSKNWFQAVRQTDGVSRFSDPDIDDKIWLFYDLRQGAWKTISPDYSTSKLSYNALDTFFPKCRNDNIWRTEPWTYCIDQWNIYKTAEINSIYKYQPNIDINAVVNSQGLGTGSIQYDDGNIYRNPIVTMTINADKVGVIRTFGEGKINSVDYPSQMTVGESYGITIKTTNVGDATMDAALNFNCGAYRISGIDQRYTLTPGQTKTDSGTITFTGGVVGCSTGDKCVLTIGNTNAVGTDDTFDFSPKVCQQSECVQIGSKDCFGNIIKECSNVGGVLKLQTVTTCQNLCVDEGYNAYCDDNTKSVCGDNICQPDEKVGESNYCPADCKEVIPVCGDGICDGREYAGEQYECVEGKQTVWDCPAGGNGGGGLSGWVIGLLIFGAVALLGGAVFLRLRMMGYFK